MLVQKKPGTIEVEVQPEQVQPAIERSYKDFIRKRRTKEERKRQFLFSCNGVPLIPKGSITALCGSKKQGKTQFLVVMAAVMMSGRPFGSLRRETAPQSILWIDTEQELEEVEDCMDRLYNLIGLPEDTPYEDAGLHLMTTWECDNGFERMQYAQQAIDDLDPDVIIIDGARDLLNDFNDVTQSNDVATWLAKNKAGRNIFTVIHTNDGSEKMRGHLGTEIGNKSSDIFLVTKKSGVFEAAHESRKKELPRPFAFKFDENSELVPVSDPSTPDFVSDPDKTLKAIFEGGTTYTFDKLISTFAKYEGIKAEKAKAYIKQHYVSTGIIEKKEGFLWGLKDEKI